MSQLNIDWSRDVSLPVAGTTPQARHGSATGAMAAASRRGALTLRYLALLERGACSDHEAARALGCGVSSVNSVRNGVAHLVEPSGDFEVVAWPRGAVTKRARWALR